MRQRVYRFKCQGRRYAIVAPTYSEAVATISKIGPFELVSIEMHKP